MKNLTTDAFDIWRDKYPLVYEVVTEYAYDLTGVMTLSAMYAQYAWKHPTVTIESFENGLSLLCDALDLEGLKIEGKSVYGLRRRIDKNDWLTLYEWIKENGGKI